jgi:hypothetical protein
MVSAGPAPYALVVDVGDDAEMRDGTIFPR